MSRLVIGIDPGIHGALGVLMLNQAQVFDMPVREKGGQAKVKTEVDGGALAELINRLTARLAGGQTTIIIETLSTMPGRPRDKAGESGHDRDAPQQSGAGTASLFDSVGCARGVVEALGFPIKWASPIRWKNYYKIVGQKDQKELARQTALELYPELAPALFRKKDHNRAEALLIARWGWDQEVHR